MCPIIVGPDGDPTAPRSWGATNLRRRRTRLRNRFQTSPPATVCESASCLWNATTLYQLSRMPTGDCRQRPHSRSVRQHLRLDIPRRRTEITVLSRLRTIFELIQWPAAPGARRCCTPLADSDDGEIPAANWPWTPGNLYGTTGGGNWRVPTDPHAAWCIG